MIGHLILVLWQGIVTLIELYLYQLSCLHHFLLYVKNDFPQALLESGSYLHADSNCIFYKNKDFEKMRLL